MTSKILLEYEGFARDARKAKGALSMIASCSPRVYNAGGDNQGHCKLCEAMINEARDARGEERWPAVPHTKKESK